MKLSTKEKNEEIIVDCPAEETSLEKTTKKRFKVPWKLLILIGILLALGTTAIILLNYDKPGTVTTQSEVSLKDIFEIGEVSSVEYTYNSIVSISTKKVKKYHVAYKGTVKAGFNFDDIKTKDDKKNKKIVIEIPEIKINDVYVDDESLDFIFVKEKYNTETIYQEAYSKCVEDLKKKAKSNKKMLEMARENGIETIRALIMPLEEQLPEGYTVEYK